MKQLCRPIILTLCTAVCIQLLACGPWFPNTLLDLGERALLLIPETVFAKEVARLKLGNKRHQAVISTNSFSEEALEADLADLDKALALTGMSKERGQEIVAAHRAQRLKIDRTNDDYSLKPEKDTRRIKQGIPIVTRGLPGEFEDYFEGAIAWHNGNVVEARRHWEDLLWRAPSQRKFRSTWAAYMLGKSWTDEDSKQAIKYFREVRHLARAGYVDSLGLAAASLGAEAQIHLRERNFEAAIELYLDQQESGDQTAVNSLRFAAAQALTTGRGALRSLAANPRTSKLITAYVTSGGWGEPPVDVDGPLREPVVQLLSKQNWLKAPAGGWHRMREPALLWLEAVEKADVRDLEAAEQIALAAYQSGEFDSAKRWCARARSTPSVRWVQAKLFARNGDLKEAARLLSGIVQDLAAPSTASGLENGMEMSGGDFSVINMQQQTQAELGVLRLATSDYTDALGLLLSSGYWADAAYIAERVLTIAELTAFVQLQGPAPPSKGRQSRYDAHTSHPLEQLRHLLARRLMREGRYEEAADFFPAGLQVLSEKYRKSLSVGRDATSSPTERAKALFQAATVCRKHGLELFGTELEPDWYITYGEFEAYGATLASRSMLATNPISVVGSNELTRASMHGGNLQARWHYRYKAADMAWEAAKLLPNNDDLTAEILCIAGSWIKNLDPQGADKFYKALVRRCRKTALGAEADRKRWFPDLADVNRAPDDPSPFGG